MTWLKHLTSLIVAAALSCVTLPDAPALWH
jgi:hypothetical protein